MVSVRQTSPDYPPMGDVPMLPVARRRILLRGIDVVIDIGANTGQYATWLRSVVGFTGGIISFEPGSMAFATLAQAASEDERWECYQCAIGREDAQVELLLARDSDISSLFYPEAVILRTWPGSVRVGSERVPMRTLNSFWPSLNRTGPVYLKLDAEGSELAALEGAGETLGQAAFIEVELSLTQNYVGGPLFHDIVDYLRPRGFTALAFEQNHGDDEATGQMLMVDGIFGNQHYPSLAAGV